MIAYVSSLYGKFTQHSFFVPEVSRMKKGIPMSHSAHVIELLKDTSFPQVLLVDGAWGSGKTYFVKNLLEDALKTAFDSELYYFSLYGLSSVDEFRDRIISLTMSGNGDASRPIKIAIDFVDSFAVNIGERGIGGILNGVAGAYKYKLYSELDDCILILDDLERVSDPKTIKNILGECLNLAETKNIKVIVVTNESKLPCKDDVEKVLVDKFKFFLSYEEIAQILKEDFNDVINNDVLYNEIILSISSIASSNIRVLKRALSKFRTLSHKITECSEVVLDESLSRVLGQVIRICYARFEADFSSDEIKGSVNPSMPQPQLESSSLDNEDSDEKLRLEKLDDVFRNEIYGLSDRLVDYCCDGRYLFEDIVRELQLPLKITLLEKMLSQLERYKMSEKEFSNGVSELIKFINTKDNLDINKWFYCCDTYVYFIDNRITSENTLSKDKVLTGCKYIKLNSFDSDSIPQHQMWNGFSSQEIYELYKTKVTELKSITSVLDNIGFCQRFCSAWGDVEDEAHQKLIHTPFLHDVGLDNLIKALEHWTSYDVFRFAEYMRHKYGFSNINDYFQPEHEAIANAITKLSKIIDDSGFGLKTGAIVKLKNTFADIDKRMRQRVNPTN